MSEQAIRHIQKVLHDMYLQAIYFDLFNTATDQRYQASFRDVYYVAPQFTTAFTNGIAPPDRLCINA